jgi:hypothetical protein
LSLERKKGNTEQLLSCRIATKLNTNVTDKTLSRSASRDVQHSREIDEIETPYRLLREQHNKRDTNRETDIIKDARDRSRRRDDIRDRDRVVVTKDTIKEDRRLMTVVNVMVLSEVHKSSCYNQ